MHIEVASNFYNWLWRRRSDIWFIFCDWFPFADQFGKPPEAELWTEIILSNCSKNSCSVFSSYLHLLSLTLKLIDPSTSANQQLSDTTLSNITIIATTTFPSPPPPNFWDLYIFTSVNVDQKVNHWYFLFSLTSSDHHETWQLIVFSKHKTVCSIWPQKAPPFRNKFVMLRGIICMDILPLWNNHCTTHPRLSFKINHQVSK